eukprot:1023111-Rhodomonas_salina.1
MAEHGEVRVSAYARATRCPVWFAMSGTDAAWASNAWYWRSALCTCTVRPCPVLTSSTIRAGQSSDRFYALFRRRGCEASSVCCYAASGTTAALGAMPRFVLTQRRILPYAAVPRFELTLRRILPYDAMPRFVLTQRMILPEGPARARKSRGRRL